MPHRLEAGATGFKKRRGDPPGLVFFLKNFFLCLHFLIDKFIIGMTKIMNIFDFSRISEDYEFKKELQDRGKVVLCQYTLGKKRSIRIEKNVKAYSALLVKMKML